jgi:predicted amidophosphoribosyltransferase
LRDALHQLKYQKRIALAYSLAEAWNHIQFQQMNYFRPAYLLPAPLSGQRLLRGFNQSWEIARKIRCNGRIQKLPYALKRHHQADA